MYGEPSAYEYGKMMSEANKAISTDGFKCCHNNAGWLGYYITTPKGNKYQLVNKRTFVNDGYYLCEYTSRPFSVGNPLNLEFKDLEECKQYLIEIESE
jgi:hypothetical protein